MKISINYSLMIDNFCSIQLPFHLHNHPLYVILPGYPQCLVLFNVLKFLMICCLLDIILPSHEGIQGCICCLVILILLHFFLKTHYRWCTLWTINLTPRSNSKHPAVWSTRTRNNEKFVWVVYMWISFNESLAQT